MRLILELRMKPLLVGLLLLNGCGGIVLSRPMTAKSGLDFQAPANAYYFLPLVKIRLIAERRSPPDQHKVLREQESRAATSESTQEDGRTIKTSTKGTSDTTKVATESTGSGTDCTLTLKDTLTEPDSRYMFSLVHRRNLFADDQVAITIGANGLLVKVETTSEGKAGQVVLGLAELAKDLLKASAGLPTDVGVFDLKKGPFQYELILDPTDATAVSSVNSDLDRRGCNLLIDVQPPETAHVRTKPTPPTSRGGIYYRPALPYVITFKTRDESRARESIRSAQTIYLPNAAPILSFDIYRPAFVKFIQTVEFENGMLKSFNLTKPSEAVGLINLPVELAKSIVSIPSELFKFRIETTQDEGGLLEAQRKLIEARWQLHEKQDELRKAQEEAQKGKAEESRQ
jgi:hypothetical protein